MLKKFVNMDASLLLFYSCSPILKTITGVRDIRMETVDELSKFCVKNGIAPGEAFLYLPEKKLTYPVSAQPLA